MKTRLLATLLGLATLGAPAWAATCTSGFVTPDLINGSGNDNGCFTIGSGGDVELGLRGKLRYDTSGQPQNTFNYDGDHTYTFTPAEGNAPANRSVFNFEWSINSDTLGNLGPAGALNRLTYRLEIDFDPTAGTDFVTFDPMDPAANIVDGYWDHAIGNNGTGNGGGSYASDTASYNSLIASNNVAQNSWNLGFFDPPGFDPQTEGLYTIRLSAFGNGPDPLASTSIDVRYGSAAPSAVPLPAGLPLLLAGLGGLGILKRRRKG